MAMLSDSLTRSSRKGLVTDEFTVQLCADLKNCTSLICSTKVGAAAFSTFTILMSEGLQTYKVLSNQATELSTTPLIPGTWVGPTPEREKLLISFRILVTERGLAVDPFMDTRADTL